MTSYQIGLTIGLFAGLSLSLLAYGAGWAAAAIKNYYVPRRK